MLGQRTLLIDADTEYSDLTPRLLSGRQGPIDDRGIVVGALGDVDLLPVSAIGGKDAASLPDLSGYDMAVVNLPPLASGPDSLAMSAQLSGVLCVAQWGSTTVAAAGQLISVIQGHGTPILGALLTRARYLTRERRYAKT
jgi:Mrp family chromosome partitioning ATPase